MSDQTCPKCGSNQIFHDECLKCGVIVSRFTLPQQVPAPPRYNVTGAPIRSVLEDAQAHQARIRRSQMQTRMIGTALFLILVLGGTAIYRTLVRHAAAYVGPYKNAEHVFGIGFPEPGWSHYSKGDLDDFGVAGIADAFWHGDSPGHPDILLLVHRGSVGMRYPSPFLGEPADQFRQATRDHLQELMEDGGYKIEFTSVEKTTLGETVGFIFRADLVREQEQLDSLYYCGFRHGGGLYAVIFIAPPEKMQEHEAELRKIGKSLNFRSTVI